MPFVAIPIPIVNAIFKITEHLDLGPDIKYIAIHLYDKFMCNYFWEVYRNADQTENSWSQVCKTISSQSKLYLMSCLQLANKMDSHCNNLRISQILSILRCIDKKSEYTHNIIFSSEYKVFRTVGFKMPFCTPLNCIEILLAAIGLKDTPNMQELTINLLDLVYLQREKLYSHLQCLIQGHIARTQQEKRNLMSLESNVLFLGASIVLCGTFFLCVDSETAKVIALKLSQLVDIKIHDIWDMANILLIMAIQE
ncbi:Cyclin N-terminal domain-containing protein 1 [Eufriesea mexicana]|uniref:Cyclin N-terminal domain-containing protein 1 n=2 Tax=Eufriesea mexicana TaxID=516756 RepID=A0A310SDQ8_9HYME|nr:Cyclin N-terminal domain-containing protein 1 [Eufriesea mexicana]